jgi:hypothetical protein
MATVGIIANPMSGKDIRRLVANAGTSTFSEKVTIVRRLIVGAVHGGATKLLVLPDPHRLCGRALDTLKLDIEIEEMEVPRTHDERETTAAGGVLRDAGAGAVVVLGGDGTNRALTLGWLDAPLLPLSTGTNNVFPTYAEPTIVGAAAGLIASKAVPLEDVSMRAKVVHVEVEGEDDDLALVDALVTTDEHAGDRRLFDPDRMRLAVLTRAEPASVGISPIAGLVEPCGAADDFGVVVRFGSAHAVDAPIAPGLYRHVGYDECRRVALGETIELDGPGTLAFDGERKRAVTSTMRFRIERDGPRVIDARGVLAAAAASGRYIVR